MSALRKLESHLKEGSVYRREDMVKWSSAVDRHLRQLVDSGKLRKLSGGLYYCPKASSFGEAPANDHDLVAAFLKDDRFLLTSPNAYNGLGVGATQLYNETVVYNHKRHGHFNLGGRSFSFRVKPHFPSTSSKEFLLVDLVNNLGSLAEDREQILERVTKAAESCDPDALLRASQRYGSLKARKFFTALLTEPMVEHER